MSTGSSSIRVMTVDDHPLLRQGIAALINTQPDMKLIAEASDGEEAIAQFRRHRPDVTLMDLQMPNANGTEAISRIRSEFPDAKILVLSTYAVDVQILRAIKAGARGYLLKGNVRTELLEAIRAVHAGRKRIPPEVAAELADHAADDQHSRHPDRIKTAEPCRVFLDVNLYRKEVFMDELGFPDLHTTRHPAEHMRLTREPR